MKGITKFFTFAFAGAIACTLMCTAAAAENDGQGTALHSLISTGTNVIANEQSKVSCALDIIAHQNQMAVAGIKGNALNFSADRFACAMNLGKIEKIK